MHLRVFLCDRDMDIAKQIIWEKKLEERMKHMMDTLIIHTLRSNEVN